MDSRIAQLCKAYGGTALQVDSFIHMWRSFTQKTVVEDSFVSFLKVNKSILKCYVLLMNSN